LSQPRLPLAGLLDPRMLLERDVRAALAIGVPLIMGYGGGVNSLAALIAMARRGIRPSLITFADTMGEKPGTYAHRAVVDEWLEANGLPPITVVVKESPNVGDTSLEAECLRRETYPSRAFGMSGCAQRWKIEPQEKHLNHWPPAQQLLKDRRRPVRRPDRPIKILGYDDGEDHRAGFHQDAKLLYWYPLIEWGMDRDACVELIAEEGLPVPPKSACFFCPSSTKSEVLQLHREHPDLYARAVAMERRALATEPTVTEPRQYNILMGYDPGEPTAAHNRRVAKLNAMLNTDRWDVVSREAEAREYRSTFKAEDVGPRTRYEPTGETADYIRSKGMVWFGSVPAWRCDCGDYLHDAEAVAHSCDRVKIAKLTCMVNGCHREQQKEALCFVCYSDKMAREEDEKRIAATRERALKAGESQEGHHATVSEVMHSVWDGKPIKHDKSEPACDAEAQKLRTADVREKLFAKRSSKPSVYVDWGDDD
jgi:hypothetical protein